MRRSDRHGRRRRCGAEATTSEIMRRAALARLPKPPSDPDLRWGWLDQRKLNGETLTDEEHEEWERGLTRSRAVEGGRGYLRWLDEYYAAIGDITKTETTTFTERGQTTTEIRVKKLGPRSAPRRRVRCAVPRGMRARGARRPARRATGPRFSGTDPPDGDPDEDHDGIDEDRPDFFPRALDGRQARAGTSTSGRTA